MNALPNIASTLVVQVKDLDRLRQQHKRLTALLRVSGVSPVPIVTAPSDLQMRDGEFAAIERGSKLDAEDVL